MTANPTLWGRMVARLQGEVPATTLEAYRRASLQVFELMDQAEARRSGCAAEGLDAWTVPAATRAGLLCAWNAFVLQTLGNDILDADYAAEPATVGFVPPVTADQVLTFYSQVEGWVNRAQQAHANPDYTLDVAVPAELPPWSQVEPCPTTHMRGIVRAMGTVADHVSAAMSFLPQAPPDDAQQKAQLNRIRQRFAAAQAKARYAMDLHGAVPSRELHERVDPHARAAIELFYELGQLIADPTLAMGLGPTHPARSLTTSGGVPQRGVLPGDPRFDPWCLTDPDARAVLLHDKQAKRALRKMWELDPDPAKTLALYDEIRAAFERGDVAYAATSKGRVGHFHCCPWTSVLVARRNVTLAGTALRTMQQFVYDVGAVNRAETFRRRIVVGTFQQTEQVEYGPHRATV
jgi:hypothetical protein